MVGLLVPWTVTATPLGRGVPLAGVFFSLSQISAVDAAIVAVYFLIMAVLSVYGLHRYQLIYLFYKHRDRATGEPDARFSELPAVTVQLPIYNERFVVEALLEAACRLDYPRDHLEIQVLDDSTDETQQIARETVEQLKALGYPIEYHDRANREGFKAGALREGLSKARGEFIAIFDADFSPPRDFLMRTIHYFTNPDVGAVQARWTHRNRDHSLLTQLQAILLDGHFVFEHGARARSGCFFNFNGTAGVLRRAMIADAGGWQCDTLTEDTDLSYRAQMKGWKYVYAPQIEVPSELPSDMVSFQIQQARWAKGLVQTAMKLLPRLLRAPLPARVKVEAWFHLTANLTFPLMAVLFALLVPAMTVRSFLGNGELLAPDLFLFLGTFSSLSSFYLIAQKELFPQSWPQRIVFIPLVVAVGIGLMINNCVAVLEALLGVRSPFERTAKYSSDPRRARQARHKYARRSRWLPPANLLAGTYFVLCLFYALRLENWWALPFLLVFVFGYYFTALTMLHQARWSDRRFEGPNLGGKTARSGLATASRAWVSVGGPRVLPAGGPPPGSGDGRLNIFFRNVPIGGPLVQNRRSMPQYRILYLKDPEVDRFRQAAPREQPYKLWVRHYEEAGRIDAPSAYAAWRELREGGAEERGIRKMGVGDVLEAEGEKLLLCNFWGFEEAEWRQAVEAAGSEVPAGTGQSEKVAAAGKD
jgi:cellulose synthase/poly-beta-1,6-N-acetylglucosamine synthase-like glycosyltransferase